MTNGTKILITIAVIITLGIVIYGKVNNKSENKEEEVNNKSEMIQYIEQY